MVFPIMHNLVRVPVSSCRDANVLVLRYEDYRYCLGDAIQEAVMPSSHERQLATCNAYIFVHCLHMHIGK